MSEDWIKSGVAIIGMAGRFPGADGVEQFWHNLCAATESITRFEDAELEDCFDAETRAASNFVKARPILKDVDQFDADFFGMYAREAELTDPQHRIFLECAWQALENGGYDPAAYRGSIGVFAGSSINTYFLKHVCADRRTIDEFTSSYQVGCYPMLLGAGQDYLATRVSYKLDLKGPSVNVQSACSTSLLAVAQACQSLLLYQADMALAGGVSVTFPQKRGYVHQEGGMVSADGSCRTFDSEASGTIFGSGAGVVLLKRLEDALADGDNIYAVIRGFGINNDGASKVGFTAPSVEGQAAAIEMAIANAGVEARSISYVECHGTATPLGDPIEIAGLSRAFRATTQDKQFCALGSVKSNIGHLDAAAGVTSLIKTALALKNHRLPASLHFKRPNPNIDFANSPFFVNTELAEWSNKNGPRRAGVSAFGVGGTNVHLVLEETPDNLRPAAPIAESGPQLLVLSARSAAALANARANLAKHLIDHPEQTLAEVAYSLQVGRRRFEHRFSLVSSDRDDAAAKLALPSNEISKPLDSSPSVVFMFPGQGSQFPDMGRDLYDAEPTFRRHVDECAAILKRPASTDIRELLFPATNSDEAKARLMSTDAAQPAIFIIEYALAKLWMSWGVTPRAMLGHSVGEFVAATLACVFTLPDALALVSTRGRMMRALPGGAMLAVRMPEQELRPLLTPALSIAAINGPALCVASGPLDAIAVLEEQLQALEIVSRRLHTSHAFHSSMVDPVISPLREHLARIRLSPASIPCVSCVTGTWLTDAQATSPDYWARHAREAVRFADSVTTAAQQGSILVEIGAGNALSTLALQTIRGAANRIITCMQDASREFSDRPILLQALGKVWALGVEPDWTVVHPSALRRVPLPSYPFERKSYWIDAPRMERGPVPGPIRTAAPSPTASPALVERATAAPVAAQNLSLPPLNSQDASVTTPPTAGAHSAHLRRTIVAIIEDLSGEKPSADDAATTFLEMGFDSLFLTQVAQKIQTQLKVKITFRQLLGDQATVPALAAYLADKVPAAAAASPAAQSTATTIAAASMPTPVGGAAMPAAVEGLFRDQLTAITQLLNRQLETLQHMGVQGLAASTPLPARVEPAAASTVATVSAGADAALAEQAPSRFAAFEGAKKPRNEAALTPHQLEFIQDLIARYSQKTQASKRLTQADRGVLADPRAAAGFRPDLKEMVYPIVSDKALGSKIWDIDGNEYIDLVNGYGQTAFGHSPEFVVAAVKEQLDRGFAIGPQTELAGKVARLFAEFTGNERVTFCNTGSEAVMAAMRLARTVTGREKIVIFNGDYHGQFDEVLVKGVQKPGAAPRSAPVAPGIPAAAVANMIVLDYGTDASLQWIRDNADDLAAVITEPVQSRHPELRPWDFLREIRKITEASGTAFVMDEVVTGFRVHPGGIQAVAGITADMATYGKVVGGGLPIGILAGKAKFMDALDGGTWNFGDASFPEVGVTFFAGTFVRHPLVMAATWAVLNHMKKEGPSLQENLSARTAKLVMRLNGLFIENGLTTTVQTYSSWFYFNFYKEHPLATLYFYLLRERGIHIQDGFPCFLTTAHSDADIERIFVAFRDSLLELKSVGFFPAKPVAVPLAAQASSTAAYSACAPGAPAISRPAEIEADTNIPLTESQIEIWLAAQLGDEASCAFNESVTLRLQGRLEEAAWRAAVERVLARHDALRVSFGTTGEHMTVHGPESTNYTLLDFSRASRAEAEESLAAFIDRDARVAFDLANGPVVRMALVRTAPEMHAFVFTAHHIVCDGWSINVIVNEIAENYTANLGAEAAEQNTPMAFSRYARSQSRPDVQAVVKTEQFWLDQFAQPTPPLALPTDRPRPSFKSYRGASLCRKIDAALVQSVKKAGAQHKATLFVTLLAAFQALMARLADQSEVVVGVPTAGQSLLDDELLVGHCVNFLPIRGRVDPSLRISEYIAATAKHVLEAYEHQNYTLGTLVRKLALTRDQGRVPLAEVQFNLERLADRIALPGLTIDVEPNAKAFVNFDIFLNVIESKDGLRLDCDYNTDLFDESTIDHWLECYKTMLEAFVADASVMLGKVEYLPASERRRLITDLNLTARDYPHHRCVHHLFEAQAAARPKDIAVQFGKATLSYEALDRRANQLAQLLLMRIGAAPTGKAAERLIAVTVDRSLDLLVTLLAVLKAGCAYVPLDASHPPARLKHILSEAGVSALITNSDVTAALVASATPVIDLRRDASVLSATPPKQPAATVAPDNLAYVIYTSGSTGVPKGVEVSHRSVVNLLLSIAREPGLAAGDALLSVTTVSFDIAGLELFLPLAVGARVVIADRETAGDGNRLARLLAESGATMMQATPSTWRLLLEAEFSVPPGFKMLCGGEGLPGELAQRLAQQRGQLWNMYGPTETTIWSSCARVSGGEEPIAVGRPIANTQFYILDSQDRLLPFGVPGQLHIGGDGVARGYHDQPAQTQDKFIANPFGAGRIYRSGDQARWLADGQLQILGRIDHQVKIRGLRIELGEIESKLTPHPSVAAAVVTCGNDARGNQRLAAYVVLRQGHSATPAQLREFLAEQLPDYMIPQAWVMLDHLPLLPNGKVDRKALPVPDAAAGNAAVFKAPVTALEMGLAKIWEEVLKIERVGSGDDIFELGADSIQLAQIVSRASRVGIKVTAKVMMQRRILSAIAAELKNAEAVPDPDRGKPRRPTLGEFKHARKATADSESSN